MKKLFRKLTQSPAPPEVRLQPHELRRLDIVDLAIEVWRLQERVKKMSAAMGKEDAASVFAAEKIRDIFSQIGIEVRDLTGQPYNEGMSLDVLARDYPADENPTHRIIQETISPAVYLDGELKKMSQVILGKAGAPDHGKTDH